MGSAYKHDKWLDDVKDTEMDRMGSYLSAALHNIERADDCVRDSAGKDASYHALSIVGHVMLVTHISALFM